MSRVPPSRGLYTPPNRRQNRPNRGKPYSKPEVNTRIINENADGPTTSLGAVRTATTTAATATRPNENNIQAAGPKPTTSTAASRPASPGGISSIRFLDFADQGKISKSLLARNPYEFCTEVQAQTMEPILSGVDV